MSELLDPPAPVGEAPSSTPTTQPPDTIAQAKEKAKEVVAASGITLPSNGDPHPSRNGSQSPSRKRKRETPLSRLQTDEYVTREYFHKALIADQAHHPSLLIQKKQELELCRGLRPVRERDPASIFGSGYAGYGNPKTDEKGLQNPILYPRHRRPGKRKTQPPRVSRKEAALQAEQSEDLVPIRLDIEFQKIKLRDTFTWNLHDRTTNIDYFAEKLVEDFGLKIEACRPLVAMVAAAIREQINEYCPQIYPENDAALDPHLPYSAYKNDEMRILVKLNITIGQNTLIDQFEWEINNPANNPELFAQQMTHELSLAGEFTTAIAHCIREQTQLFSRSLHLTGYAFDGRSIEDPDLKDNFLPSPMYTTFRPYQAAKDYAPYVYELNDADLEKTELSFSREQRRQKRSTNRRGGPALPDLKDRHRTIRSLVVSSVIPGGSLTMEDSRIFKIATKSRRSARRITGGVGGDEFDDSDGSADQSGDDASGPDSPGLASLLHGTARTRGTMRTAAMTATAGIRSNLSGFAGARSTTPDSMLQQTQPDSSRARRREFNYREESDDDNESVPEKLIVKLRIGREKYRAFMRQQNAKEKLKVMADSASTGTGSPMTAKTGAPSPLKLAGGPGPGSGRSPAPTPASGAGFNAVGGAGNAISTATTTATSDPLFGAADATATGPTADNPAPPIPAPLTQTLTALRLAYPSDRFEALMKHTGVDPTTTPPTIIANASDAKQRASEGKEVEWKYVPRVRCLDCLGRVYYAMGFESHLKNRGHREKVEARLRGGAGEA